MIYICLIRVCPDRCVPISRHRSPRQAMLHALLLERRLHRALPSSPYHAVALGWIECLGGPVQFSPDRRHHATQRQIVRRQPLPLPWSGPVPVELQPERSMS